jgi:Flp pilus assembly protein TadG
MADEHMSRIKHNFLKLHELHASQSGAIAPIFGLMLMVVMIATGVSIDTARGNRIASMASSALDAAALAGAKALRLSDPTDAELTALVLDYFNTNFQQGSSNAAVQSISVVPNRQDNSVELVANIRVPTTIMAITGKEHMDVTVNAAAVFDVKDVEVSMMLDVSGSMAGSKIQDLKAAAGDLIEILLPTDVPHSNRVAIAPFSTAVNAGDLAASISNGVDSRGRSMPGRYTTCVTERAGEQAFTDASPSTAKLNRRSASCPVAEIQPLTNDLDTLGDAIDSLAASGMTAGHLGIAWASYLLSPNWSSVFSDDPPVAYDNTDFRKVAILMTDGMFNNYYENANGTSVTQARALCDSMKANGVTVYTVGFQVPADVVPTLQYCATTPAHYYSAEDGAALRQTFKEIAKRLNGLRLSS